MRAKKQWDGKNKKQQPISNISNHASKIRSLIQQIKHAFLKRQPARLTFERRLMRPVLECGFRGNQLPSLQGTDCTALSTISANLARHPHFQALCGNMVGPRARSHKKLEPAPAFIRRGKTPLKGRKGPLEGFGRKKFFSGRKRRLSQKRRRANRIRPFRSLVPRANESTPSFTVPLGRRLPHEGHRCGMSLRFWRRTQGASRVKGMVIPITSKKHVN